MKTVAKAKICFIPPESGGKKQLPSGLKYMTIAKFKDIKESNEGWSLISELYLPYDNHFCILADVYFLVEQAPHSLLYPGSRFELWEHKIVAKGIVIS